MTRQAVILAGGMGTRLRERLGDLPKPMIPIGGKPLIEHQVELAARHGCRSILILAGYRAEVIQAHLGDGSRWGVHIEHLIERHPLGTAGAVLEAWPHLADRLLVLYGDEMVNVDLDRLWRAHETHGADATLLLHPNDHPLDSDLVEVDDQEWISAFHNRPHPPGRDFQNLVNAALYVIEKVALTPWSGHVRAMDFGKDLFPALQAQGGKLLGYRSPEFIKDIGTPERYDRVCAEFARGVVARSSFEVPQVAVFLDRDGTLNREIDGVTTPDQLELLPGAAAAVRELNHHGLRAVVITNQPVVAKGFCDEATLGAIHRRMETLLGREKAFLDRIYVCPHHPEKGFAGERPELKIDCACRKPKPGLVQQAAKDLNLDLGQCWFIGDTTTDVQTARNAGVKAVLVRTGHGGRDAKHAAGPDFSFDNLGAAVHFIVEQQEKRA